MKIQPFQIVSSLAFAFSMTALLAPQASWAIDPVIRPHLSARSVGMGGLRISTGLYDENFFNNPARVTANPYSKLTLLQITPEINSDTISAIQNRGSDTSGILTNNAGKAIHGRTQLVFPSWYLATTETRRFALAIGVLGGLQTDLLLSNSYRTSGNMIVDLGPAITLGYQLLQDRSLSIGVTGHFNYRFSAKPDLSMIDLIGGTYSGLSSIAGHGGNTSFDLGATWEFFHLGDWEFNLAAAIQNVLGTPMNQYRLINIQNISGYPIAQPRSYGFGFSIYRKEFLMLKDSIAALELTDYGNNPNGSLYRLIHAGFETHFGPLAFRAGLNQGYWTAGLGLDLHFINLNLATYGEELGLTSGVREDRRYTLSLGIHL